jgi:hypothetical protein
MNIQIQFQDINGSWMTTSLIDGSSTDQNILIEMKNIKMMHKDNRIRAIDDSGRLIDMLP